MMSWEKEQRLWGMGHGKHHQRDPHTTKETLTPPLAALSHLVATHSSQELQGIQLKGKTWTVHICIQLSS